MKMNLMDFFFELNYFIFSIDQSELREMMRGIQMECLNNLEDVSVEETLKSGHICFARDVGDNRWYRGQIIDFPSCVEGSSKVSKLIQKI